MNILFIGDIVGKVGRKGVIALLPQWRKQYEPDLVIANAENAAHGVGVTSSIIEELQSAGVDFFTTGNHWADKIEGVELFSSSTPSIIRPANWIGNVPGRGYRIIEVGATPIAIVNLIGQVFIREDHDSPFHAFDRIIKEIGKKAKIIIVDFHGEATSEKLAFGYYADGRVSAVLGTHTHVQTADERILPNGTAYMSDVGMCGGYNSIIGKKKESIIAMFLDQLPRKHDLPEDGEAELGAALVAIDAASGRAKKITRIREICSV